MLEKFIYYLIPSLINFIGMFFLLQRLLNKCVNFKGKRVYIGIFIFLILNIFNYLYVDGFLRMISNTVIVMFVSYIIFNCDISLTFGSAILQQVLYFASELLCAIIFSIFKLNMLTLSGNNYLSFIIINVIISLFAIIIYEIKPIRFICSKLIQHLEKISGVKKIVIMFVFFITLNVLLMLIYYTDNNRYLIFINSVFIIVYSIIIYMLILEKNNSIQYREQNEILLGSLNDYEKMLDYQRVNNHENKNQLLVIKGMIDKNNKKVLDYLDEIITEKRNDDEGLYAYTKIIPEGGLQGLVYQKMLKMKEYDIKTNLNFNKNIRKVDFNKLSSRSNYDLCRAVGVILDNSIEETIKLKNREILISMYKDEDYFIIEVSNKCSKVLDLSVLDEKGYTTKPQGHGYGLSLLKSIVSNNKYIINTRSISKDIFTQIIKIKM